MRSRRTGWGCRSSCTPSGTRPSAGRSTGMPPPSGQRPPRQPAPHRAHRAAGPAGPAAHPRTAGIVASMQPLHVSRPDRNYSWTDRVVGRRRWREAFPSRDVHGIGAPLTFGSDWPIVTMEPYRGLEALVTRQCGQSGCPTRRLTRHGAGANAGAGLRRIPREQARSRRPGGLADLVLLTLTCLRWRRGDCQGGPVLTVCNGRVVY